MNLLQKDKKKKRKEITGEVGTTDPPTGNEESIEIDPIRVRSYRTGWILEFRGK